MPSTPMLPPSTTLLPSLPLPWLLPPLPSPEPMLPPPQRRCAEQGLFAHRLWYLAWSGRLSLSQ